MASHNVSARFSFQRSCDVAWVRDNGQFTTILDEINARFYFWEHAARSEMSLFDVILSLDVVHLVDWRFVILSEIEIGLFYGRRNNEDIGP